MNYEQKKQMTNRKLEQKIYTGLQRRVTQNGQTNISKILNLVSHQKYKNLNHNKLPYYRFQTGKS